MMNIVVIILVCVGVLGLAITCYLSIAKINQNKIDAENEKTKAFEVQRLTATRVILDEELEGTSNDEEEEKTILLSLYSKPSGAAIFFNGIYIGDTPIDERKMLKSADNLEIVASLDGYETARRTVSLSEDTSEILTLNEVIIERVYVQKEQKSAPQDGVVANNAVVIDSDAIESEKIIGGAAAPGIILPD